MGSTGLLNISVHNTKQKQLLYKYFIEGEETGKMSPKQAEQALHSKLTVEEYVTVRHKIIVLSCQKWKVNKSCQ